MVQANKVVNGYYVMMLMYNDTDGTSAWIPFSKMIHRSRFQAFLEMEHAKDDPMYAGEIFEIRELSEWSE